MIFIRKNLYGCFFASAIIVVPLNISPKLEPALELISRVAPSVEAHHCSVGPDAGRNSRGRQIIKKNKKITVLQFPYKTIWINYSLNGRLMETK